MVKLEVISANLLKITAPDKLHTDDFKTITPQVDALISQFGSIRLLVDVTGFHGWDSLEAFETHAGFVKAHQAKVERIAVITAHDWQQWLAGTIKLFVYPEVKTFGTEFADEALQWLQG